MRDEWSEKDVELLKRCFARRYSQTAMADALGRSQGSVAGKLSALGLSGGNPKGRPEDDPDTVSNPRFVYDGPGYFLDRTGTRWLIGEDADGDLVGINLLTEDPLVRYWDPCGRAISPDRTRDLVGPLLARRTKTTEADRAMAFHRSN